MYQTLLVPLDGSEFAEEALPMAALLARTLDAELHLAHVIRPAYDVDFKTPQEDFEWKETIWDGAEAYLEGHAEALRKEGVSALTAVLEGRVVQALGDYGDEQDVDLTVLTSHGRGGVTRFWLGSVADGLLRHAHSDLLLVRPWDETEDRTSDVSRFGRILVPLDGSELAESALVPARALAAGFEAAVRTVRVVPKPLELTSIYGVRGVELAGEGHRAQLQEAHDYLEAVRERVDPDAPEGIVIENSGAASGIVDAAKAWEADLIVLSSHGRGGAERVVLGSVADKVIRGTTRPVLVIRRDREEETTG